MLPVDRALGSLYYARQVIMPVSRPGVGDAP